MTVEGIKKPKIVLVHSLRLASYLRSTSY